MNANTRNGPPSVPPEGPGKASGKRRKTTIFKIFLLPLIAIMLLQSAITIGTLVVRRTTETLEEYAGSMMERLVENRGVILQNDMNQRWSSVAAEESMIENLLVDFLEEENVGLDALLRSGELKARLLNRILPECLDILQSNTTTGIFLILTGPDRRRGIRRSLHPGFRPLHQSRQLYGPAAGAGEQAALQSLEHPPGHPLDHPVSHGGPGDQRRPALFL